MIKQAKIKAWKSRREPTLKEYLMNRIIKVDGPLKTKCWIWKTAKGKRCGVVEYDGISEVAPRASFKFFKGKIPKGKLIRHKCDDARCINPDHLIPGTDADNKRDYMERNPKAFILLRKLQKLGNAANKGRKQSTEERAMRSAVLMGNQNACGNKGKSKSIKHRKNISKAKKGMKFSKEHCQALSIALTNYHNGIS